MATQRATFLASLPTVSAAQWIVSCATMQTNFCHGAFLQMRAVFAVHLCGPVLGPSVKFIVRNDEALRSRWKASTSTWFNCAKQNVLDV
uniref:Secreted protein n=1 Tax=Globodera pallida TaxID=36090 RepID=A0A183CRD1_GLOPA